MDDDEGFDFGEEDDVEVAEDINKSLHRSEKQDRESKRRSTI